jgi:hypothetical protein
MVCVLAVLVSVASAVDGAKYLIVAADDQESVVQPLADWKTGKGVPAMVVPLSVAGTTPAAVQTYIRNAWNTWPST